jgi:tRNA(Ile2) C34 agmatinyltransferase TiaS
MANPFQTTDQGASDAYKRSLQNKSKSDKKKEYAKKMTGKPNECPACGKKQKSAGRCASCMVNE